MKKCLSAAALLIVIAAGLGAESLPRSSELLSGLDAEVIRVLDSNDHVFRYDEENAGPLYIPATKGFDKVRAMTEEFSPEVMVEAVYRVPYPADFQPEDGDILDYLYELSHRVSTISGVKYYSESRKKYAVLFTDVYAVDSGAKNRRLEDPKPGDENYADLLHLHMKENDLGRGYYRLEYDRGDGSMVIRLTNESELRFIVKAVETEDLHIILQVIPCSDTILIYGYCGTVMQNDDLVSLLLDPNYAFYRRMTAMETWLYNILHGTDRLPPLSEPLP